MWWEKTGYCPEDTHRHAQTDAGLSMGGKPKANSVAVKPFRLKTVKVFCSKVPRWILATDRNICVNKTYRV